VPEGFQVLHEGQAAVIYRPGESFYNNVQVVNRDLSVLMLRLYDDYRREKIEGLSQGRRRKHIKTRNGGDEKANDTELGGMRVFEGLSATGLRAIRYAKEVEAVREVVANDLAPEAVRTIRRNVQFAGSGDKVVANEGDAVMVMMQHSRDPAKQFDAVDLDPYGSAAPFLDSAVQSVCDGGLLLVTCTDLAVLCGNHPDICFAKYSAQALKYGARHEAAVRIVLHCIQAAALRYGRCIVPLVALQIDFYLRVFVVIKDSKIECKEAAPKVAVQYQCTQCESFFLQPLGRQTRDGPHPQFWPATTQPFQSPCQECGGEYQVGGPMYCHDLGDKEVVQRLVDALQEEAKRTAGGKEETRESKSDEKGEASKHGYAYGLKSVPRLRALLGGLLEELCLPGLPGALHMNMVQMCQALSISTPPMGLVYNALEAKGYAVCQSHTDAQAIKTDAPVGAIWDLLRCHAIKQGTLVLNQESSNNEKQKNRKKKKSGGYPLLRNKAPTISDWDFSKETHRLCGRMKKTGALAEGEVYAPKFPHNPEKNWGPKRAASSKRFKKEEAERAKKQKQMNE